MTKVYRVSARKVVIMYCDIEADDLEDAKEKAEWLTDEEFTESKSKRSIDSVWPIKDDDGLRLAEIRRAKNNFLERCARMERNHERR